MLRTFDSNRFIQNNEQWRASKKPKYLFPVIQRCTFDVYDHRSINSCHRQASTVKISSHEVRCSKASRTNSVERKFKQKVKENKMRMERSINRFLEKENQFNQTLLQKKKQKKYYGIDNLQNEEINFFKSVARQKLLKQQAIQEENMQIPLTPLPNSCYDSQFTFQREGNCLTILNNKLYLFGGAIRRKFYYQSQSQSNMDVLFHSYEEGRWIREPVANQIPIDKKNLIHHSVNAANKKYIVIAGGMMGDSQKTLSKFNESILVYNTENKKMHEISCTFRIRSHASLSFENLILLQGGINEEANVACQLYIIALSLTNQNLGVKVTRYDTNEARVHHQLVSTLAEDKNFKINLRENNGIYLFGGEDGNGKMDSNLRILKIYTPSDFDRKGVKSFQIVKTSGEPPCPRKNHSMSLVSKKNSIVVLGGLDVRTNPLSDVWLIQLCQLTWRRVQTEPSIQVLLGGISKHASASNSSSIYILGGRCERDLGKQNLWKLEFNTDNYERMKTRQRRNSKISSSWSIGNQLGYSDKLLFND